MICGLLNIKLTIAVILLELLSKQRKTHSNRELMVISWPFDAIHKTHIHFNGEEMTLGKAPDWETCM